MFRFLTQGLAIMWEATWEELLRRPLLLIGVVGGLTVVFLSIFSPRTLGNIFSNVLIALVGPLASFAGPIIMVAIVLYGLRYMIRGGR